MASTPLTSQQAYEIARGFHLMAVAVGTYRFSNWGSLTPDERKELEDYEWTLSNYSSDFNYKSITLLLDSQETQTAVVNITDTTKEMENAIDKLATVGKVIAIATAAFTLGGAIISGNPQAIGNAIAGAVSAVKGDDEEK
jgi:hypothetical protein